jgi:trk system potassium uptake protein
MNLRILSKLVGSLLLFLAASQVFCLAFSWWIGESADGLDSVEAFSISIGFAVISGLALLGLGRGSDNELLRRESVSVVGLGWIFCTLYGALPYFLCEPRMSLANSLFESVSGFTATGATVISDIEVMPRSLLLWRALTQWLGGMGILVLFVALLSSFGAGSKALFRHESSTFETEGLSPRIQWISIQLWGIYVTMTLVCFLGLRMLGMGNFDAFCHTCTTVATGGFSTYNASIGHFNSLGIEMWIIIFMVLGSINFMLYAWLIRRQWDRWRQDEASRVLLIVLFSVTVLIAANLFLSGMTESVPQSLRQSAFQVVAIMTTTGFATADFDQWPAFSVILLILLMVVGGCAGSTSGGLKVGRLILFFKIIRYQLKAGFRPNQVMKLKLNGNNVSDRFRVDTLFLISTAGVAVLVGSVVVCLLQPQLDLRSCVSAVLATLFNIGPALGDVGPTRHYGDLNGVTKIFLSFLMVLGRLEFYALMVLFMPSLWKRY